MAPSDAVLAGRRLLVVEDDYLIAVDTVDLLRSAGATVLGPAVDVQQALALLDRETPDLAVLDLDLHGQPSYPVADLLVARGVPFVFTTGFSAEIIPAGYLRHLRLQKPVAERALLAALKTAWQSGR